MQPEREITADVELADADGCLRPEAIGWSRQPLHRLNLAAGLARCHAFDYWCVTSRAAALSVLTADVGIAGIALVSLLDLASESVVERVYVRPGGLRPRMPPSTDGEVVVHTWGLHLVAGPQRIEARARTLTGRRIEADLAIERPTGHETVNVVVPWTDTCFHFTSKQQALPVRGRVVAAGRTYDFDPDAGAFACRDFGRGRWPKGIDWGWAFASTRQGGRTIGFNLGGRWTDGTGVTENGLVIDGRIHKIADAVDFNFDARDQRRPWRIRTRDSARVDLTFTPSTLRKVTVPPFLRLRQCFGSYSGTVVDDAGTPIRIDDALGLAETVRGRW